MIKTVLEEVKKYFQSQSVKCTMHNLAAKNS